MADSTGGKVIPLEEEHTPDKYSIVIIDIFGEIFGDKNNYE